MYIYISLYIYIYLYIYICISHLDGEHDAGDHDAEEQRVDHETHLRNPKAINLRILKYTAGHPTQSDKGWNRTDQIYMTLGRCPLSVVCSRGTPPRVYYIISTFAESVMLEAATAVHLRNHTSAGVWRRGLRLVKREVPGSRLHGQASQDGGGWLGGGNTI